LLVTVEITQFNNIDIALGIGITELISKIFERYASFYHFGI
jgi:hypothetical protein